MLGLVIAGNLAMVFAFWELVGICSYLLIGFYIERRSASNAANKAFIVNRVGDFGMIIGLMAVFAGMQYVLLRRLSRTRKVTRSRASSARSDRPPEDHEPQVPDRMVIFTARIRSGQDRGGQQQSRRPRQQAVWSQANLETCGASKAMATGSWLWPGWASSVVAWVKATSFPCTSGCRTPWRAPRPSAP